MREVIVVMAIVVIAVPVVLWRRRTNRVATETTTKKLLAMIDTARVKGATQNCQLVLEEWTPMRVATVTYGGRRLIRINLGSTRGEFTPHQRRVQELLKRTLDAQDVEILPETGDSGDEYNVYIPM